VSGYVTDTTYADTFFRELSPTWLNYVAALNGAKPTPLDSRFRYLELGCGFGTSAVVNAASFPHATFDACDFNRSHVEGGIAYAAQLALSNITFHPTAFEDLPARNLEPYDFIVMHGVYSWVDAATRAVLRRLVDRLLRPGGLLYVSYNALPGWSNELPLRKLLVELAAAEAGTAGQRAGAAVDRIDRLQSAGLRYFTANPGVKPAVDAYVRGEGHYLAHEFMNRAWEPFYAVDVADEFGELGLQFAGSATLPNNHLPLMVDAASARAIGDLSNVRQQQLVADFAINQRFRRDIFVRAAGAPPHSEDFEQTVIGCTTDVGDIAPTVRVPRGEIQFQEPFVRDVRALFAHRSCLFGEAVAELARHGHDGGAIGRNLVFLVAGGALAPFARRFDASSARPTRLAGVIPQRALHDAPDHSARTIIPSEVCGNGVELDSQTADTLRRWSRGEPVSETFVARQLPALARLGIVA